jgi:hypothetical protein
MALFRELCSYYCRHYCKYCIYILGEFGKSTRHKAVTKKTEKDLGGK